MARNQREDQPCLSTYISSLWSDSDPKMGSEVHHSESLSRRNALAPVYGRVHSCTRIRGKGVRCTHTRPYQRNHGPVPVYGQGRSAPLGGSGGRGTRPRPAVPVLPVQRECDARRAQSSKEMKCRSIDRVDHHFEERRERRAQRAAESSKERQCKQIDRVMIIYFAVRNTLDPIFGSAMSTGCSTPGPTVRTLTPPLLKLLKRLLTGQGGPAERQRRHYTWPKQLRVSLQLRQGLPIGIAAVSHDSTWPDNRVAVEGQGLLAEVGPHLDEEPQGKARFISTPLLKSGDGKVDYQGRFKRGCVKSARKGAVYQHTSLQIRGWKGGLRRVC